MEKKTLTGKLNTLESGDISIDVATKKTISKFLERRAEIKVEQAREAIKLRLSNLYGSLGLKIQTYDLTYLLDNIDMNVILDVYNEVKDTEEEAHFQIGDIPMCAFDNGEGALVLQVNLEPKGITLTTIKIGENEVYTITKEELCDRLYKAYDVNVGDTIIDTRQDFYLFLDILKDELGNDIMIPVGGNFIKFHQYGYSLLYVGESVIHMNGEYEGLQVPGTTTNEFFVNTVNVWEIINYVVGLQNK